MPKTSFLINREIILNDLINPKMYMRALKVITYTFLGKDMPVVSPDRNVLEQKILPYFIREKEFAKVLFAGCGSYTKHYEKWFKHKEEYSTTDINPFKKLYGAKKHIVDSYSHVGNYFPANYLDVIICHGIFGFGWNEREDVEQGFAGSFKCLRDGGILVVGWRDTPETKPFPLETCQSLSQFKPYVFPPVSTSQLVLEKYLNIINGSEKHVFNFYIK